MSDSPLAESPYTVLGVSEQASDSELRRTYRRKLRETHPDTGGEAARFDLIQRAWEQLGTPEGRAAYDSGAARPGSRANPSARSWAPQATSSRMGSTRPESLMHGHAGRWNREQYLELLHEWVGAGVNIPDPYDPKLVRSTPRAVRHPLASAIAEEDTAIVLAGLGMGFTVWNSVRTASGAVGQGAARKIDHIVLGPTGLWGMLSEDWGASVAARGGDIVGHDIHPDERPMHDLATRAREFERQAKVRFSALAIVAPDDASPEGVETVGTIRGAPTFLVQRARLANLIRAREPGVAFGGTDLFEVRTRVQSAARFV
ncbi:MAG: J domain-containing protein [Pseudolysinimonas sp.]|uniref:J domain-containing protein n=1 Tax=Pseudolysinimonas sp. TaxID=2680009 RepID=UPI003264F691